MRSWQKEDGFSLVETLLVVAIVGLMAGVAVLSLPGENRALEDEIRQSQAALIAISRQSVISGRIHGLKLAENGFELQVLTDDGWAVEGDLLKPEARSWGQFSLLKVTVEGAEVDIRKEALQPHVWFLPTGEFPDFELLLTGHGQGITLSAASGQGVEVRYAQ